jgi:hypothetical protein
MVSARPKEDRRKNRRLESNIPIKISQDGGDFVTETRNISRSGAYCRANQYIAPMTKLKVHLLLSIPRNGKPLTKKISCEGVVVRSDPADDKGCHIAIFFNDIKQRDAESITDYVNKYLKDEDEL